MRVLSIVCLALALPQFAGAQDTVAPDGGPPPAPPAVEAVPPEPAPVPEQAAPPAPEQPPAPAQAAPPPVPPQPAPQPYAPPAAPPQPAPQPYAPPPAPTQAPPAYQPPAYQPPAYQPYQPPSYGYGYPPPRPVAPAPPPWSYTPQPSPLLNQPWPPPQAPAQPAPGGTYYYYPPPTYVAPPVTLPPLPQGYSYVPAPLPPIPNTQLQPPAAEGASRDQLYARLHDVDTRLDALRAERISVGGPIFAMVFGFGTMAIAGVVGIAAADSAREIKNGHYESRGYYDSSLDFNDDGDVDRGDRNNWVKTARVGAGIAGAGFLLGLIGSVGLRRATEQRRENAEEQKKLRSQHIALRRQLDYGPTLGQSQYGLSVKGRF